jgi:Na+-driven multidrug efflux pump
MVQRYDKKLRRKIGGKLFATSTANRLMTWGLLLGIALGSLQILLLPIIQQSTPLQAVRDAAMTPSILASVYQIINGMVFIGEGVMIGSGSFLQLSLSTVIATAGCLWALKVFPPIYGLAGVWMGFGVFNVLRLGGVFLHQRVNGPFAPRNLKEEKA